MTIGWLKNCHYGHIGYHKGDFECHLVIKNVTKVAYNVTLSI